jgi:hypothetical protein
VHARRYGNFPAKTTVYTPNMYGFGQSFVYMVFALL